MGRRLTLRLLLVACLWGFIAVAFTPVRHFGPGGPLTSFSVRDPGTPCGPAAVAFFGTGGCHDAAASRLYWLAVPGAVGLGVAVLSRFRRRSVNRPLVAKGW